MATKFLKARCQKTGLYFGLELQQQSGTWKVVNMTRLSDQEARLSASEVEQPSFDTARNLLACAGCGSRRVGGCSCAKKVNRCSAAMGYRFNCIYCSELKPDYTLPRRSGAATQEGGTVRLSQGQEVKIRYADDRPLSRIYVGVGWDPATQGDNIDVDSSVVVMGGCRSRELVYFADKRHASGCVVHHGDNLTGETDGNNDDENISVYLDQVPADRDALVFVLNIYACADRGQTFGGIRNLYIRLYDPDSGNVLVEYPVTGNFSRDTGLIIGKAYRKNGQWLFKAIGRGTRAVTVHDLARDCESCCV